MSMGLCSLGRQGGHHELAERLVEIQYELTDRLAFYLCGRKPGEGEEVTLLRLWPGKTGQDNIFMTSSVLK